MLEAKYNYAITTSDDALAAMQAFRANPMDDTSEFALEQVGIARMAVKAWITDYVALADSDKLQLIAQYKEITLKVLQVREGVGLTVAHARTLGIATPD